MRKEKNGNRYFSFDELAQNLFNFSFTSVDTTPNWDAKKIKEVKEAFEKKHSCRSCGKPMIYKGGNIMCCLNPKCSKQGFHLLSEKGKRIAINLEKINTKSEVKA